MKTQRVKFIDFCNVRLFSKNTVHWVSTSQHLGRLLLVKRKDIELQEELYSECCSTLHFTMQIKFDCVT
jgi:hypothetical protein